MPPAEDANWAFEFSFRRDLLDRLPDFERCARALRSASPHTYNLCREIGATVLPASGSIHRDDAEQRLTPAVLCALPAFGAVAFTQDLAICRPDRVSPSLFSFVRMESAPAGVETESAESVAVYALQFCYPIWTKARRARRRFVAMDAYCQLFADGRIAPLRVRCLHPQQITHRRHTDGGRTSVIMHVAWGADPLTEDWTAQRGLSVAGRLLVALNLWAGANSSMCRITASRGGVTAAFAVKPERMSAVFKDRERVLTATGRTAPIFHAVRSHVRRLPSGATAGVRLHFAGLRDFRWNGFDVRVRVPGRDSVDLVHTPGFAAIDEHRARAQGSLAETSEYSDALKLIGADIRAGNLRQEWRRARRHPIVRRRHGPPA